MTYRIALFACLVSISMIAVSGQTKPSLGNVEFTDAAGDVDLLHFLDGGTEKTFPGFDVVRLSIASDGTQITVAATLKAPPAEVASSVVDLYFDLDNSKTTGAVAALGSDLGGFEFVGQLRTCVVLSNSMESCAGGIATPTARLVRRYAIVSLDRFKGASKADGLDQVVDSAGFFAPMKALHVPIIGSLVQASLTYDALKVAPRRTIRLVARESSTAATQGFFPEALLTLN